jgi:UDP-2-acetamido-3-amino-2,3-dideoxy-glucuronate N-acetyltransferase
MERSYKRSVALIGCGQWGKNIARDLAELGALRLVCDANETTVPALAKSLGAEFTTDIQKVLENPEIESVAIAAPAILHAELSIKCLLAGKQVYVEKPIALSMKDAREVASVAAARGRVLMVGHLLQYHPGFRKLLSIVREGKLGKIAYVYSHRLNQGRIRTEENALWSLAPHDFSMVLALVGEAPNVVTAHGHAAIQPSIEDIAIVHLGFACGAKAHIFCSWLNPYKEHKISVVGSEAMAVFDDTPADYASKSLVLYRHKVNWDQGHNIPSFTKGDGERIAFDDGNPLLNELSHFLQCVATGETPRTGPHEAIPVLDALEKAQLSMVSAAA